MGKVLNKLENINDDAHVLFVPEPVNEFRKCKLLNYDYNPLKEFYYDKNKNGVAFQCWVNECYNNQLQNLCTFTTQETKLYMDRCVYSSIIFARTLNRLKVFSDFTESYLEVQALKTIKTFYGEEELYGLDKVYYINTPIDVCIEQIHKRDRTEEIDVQNLKRYLTVLDIEYKLFLYEFIKKKGIDKVRVFYHPNTDIVVQDFLKFVNED